jgi:predicted Zn-dependent peptidase
MVKKQVLKNGLTLITAPLKETKVVTILVLFGIGSRFETRPIRGLSHFIEHMMFKGTKKRPTAAKLVREIDALGAVFNAFTGKDMTGYYIKVDQSHFPVAVEILSDMLQNSLIDNREMQREKNVIIEEINMREDTPMIHVEDVFEEVLFGDQPIGWDTAGTRDSIKGMRRQDFVSYIKRYYTTGNAVAVITGEVDHERAAKLVTDKFQSLPAKARAHPRKTNLAPTKRKAELIFRQSEQSHLVIGFPAFPYCHPRLSALKVLHTALGGNMSSRLFHIIRDKHGLAYYVRSSINSYSDTGTLVVQAGLDNLRVEKAIQLITKEIKKFTQTAVGTKELKRAKDFLKGQIAIQLEDQENLADWLARRHLFEHKLISVDEYLADIEKVTAGDVKSVAQEIFKVSKMNLTMIGPFNDKAKFLKLLNL